jgi:hypothetical protein
VTMELSDFIKSGRASKPCPKDENCLYTEGHTCPCTPVEIGEYVARKREGNWTQAHRNRLQAIMDASYAMWFDDLLAAGTSPLLFVGWVSKGATTWHRDRYCKRNQAMGQLSLVLCMETTHGAYYSKYHPCAGCAQLSDWEKKEATRDLRQLKVLRREKTEGLCWHANYADCGADVVPGTTTCAKHVNAVTEACRVGRHDDCDKILAVITRKDGSTYSNYCNCMRCDHPGFKKE